MKTSSNSWAWVRRKTSYRMVDFLGIPSTKAEGESVGDPFALPGPAELTDPDLVAVQPAPAELALDWVALNSKTAIDRMPELGNGLRPCARHEHELKSGEGGNGDHARDAHHPGSSDHSLHDRRLE